MAPYSNQKIISFLSLVVGLILTYHAIVLVEGGMASARSILAEAEDSELERQLKILNKPSIKTLHVGNIKLFRICFFS